MRVYRFLIALILLALGSATWARADQIDDYVKRQMERNHIPGMAVAIIRDGKLAKTQGYGSANLEWDAGVSSDTAFQMASGTKMLTGTLLMKLVEDGKIGLDDPVSKYIPEAPATWKEITVRRLAAHQSGLKMPPLSSSFKTLDEAVKAASELPLEYEPGAKDAYASSDYTVLMKVIEKATGKSYEQALRDIVFAPLGMSGTGFDHARNDGLFRNAGIIKKRATVYAWDRDKNEQNISWMVFPDWTAGAGGLLATPSDLARWIAALDSGKLLRRESLDQMWSGQRLTNGETRSFGLGWVVGTYRGRKTVGHSGGPALSDILYFPNEKLAVIVQTNQLRLYPHFAQGIADLLLPPSPVAETKGIQDNDPKTTQALRTILENAARESFDFSLFTEEAQKTWLPELKSFASTYFGGLDPLNSFVLIEDKVVEGKRIRRYRTIYGTKPIIWTFTLDQNGRVADMEPKIE